MLAIKSRRLLDRSAQAEDRAAEDFPQESG